MQYQLVIKTDANGRPHIDMATPLIPNATYTITGAEEVEEDPWTRLIVVNDIVIDTGKAKAQVPVKG